MLLFIYKKLDSFGFFDLVKSFLDFDFLGELGFFNSDGEHLSFFKPINTRYSLVAPLNAVTFPSRPFTSTRSPILNLEEGSDFSELSTKLNFFLKDQFFRIRFLIDW